MEQFSLDREIFHNGFDDPVLRVGLREALEGQDRVSGYRVEVREGKDKVPSTVWVTNDGRLLQLDLANGERLIVEPKVGEPGLTKVKMGGG